MIRHSILIIGQSNMAGRGFMDGLAPIDNNRMIVLKNGRWQYMFRPVNFDRPFSGVCLAESFAEAYAKDHEDVKIGVIPCADGGTTLDQWAVGGALFDNAVSQAKLAQRTSQIVGVLWHQGEGDCAEELYPLYEEKFLKIMNAFRQQLGLENVPFIVGGLGDFLSDNVEFGDTLKNYQYINETLQKIASEQKMVGFASAKGLTSNPDVLHFNTPSLNEFGLRYYAEWKRFEGEIEFMTEEMIEEKRSAMERL